MNDLVSRQAALDILDDFAGQTLEICHGTYEKARRQMCELPSAQLEITKRTAETIQNIPNGDLISRKAAIDAIISESTADGVYGYVDTKSIMNLINKLTSAQQKPQWIPVKAHSATDEEKENCPSIDYWFDCPMPNDDQEILVTVRHKNYLSVEKDVCYVDDTIGLDSGYDWLTDVIAWMPLPEPYREEGEE